MTLIARDGDQGLDDGLVQRVDDALQAAGAKTADPEWLAPGLAVDLPVIHLPPSAAETSARRAVRDLAIDVVVQPVRGRRKRLLVADLESTIIRQEMLDELARSVGLHEEIAAITQRAMRGELDFEAALAERVGKMKGLSLTQIAEAAVHITLSPGAQTLLATLRAHGSFCALVSGGFTVFARLIAERLGFDDVRANKLEVEGDYLTGRVVPPIMGGDGKLQALREYCMRLGISTAEACTVGDGANDLPMLRAAGLGVAWHAKPIVRAGASMRLDYADLTGILYLQGFRQSEFLEA